PVPPAVEDVAGDDHERLPAPGEGREQPAHQEDDGKEDGEVDRGKEHQTRRSSPRVPARRSDENTPPPATKVIVGDPAGRAGSGPTLGPEAPRSAWGRPCARPRRCPGRRWRRW